MTSCTLLACDYSITGVWSLIPLLGVKIIHIIDRTDLFKISNLVYDGREIVVSLCSSLEKTEREREREREREFMADIVS